MPRLDGEMSVFASTDIHYKTWSDPKLAFDTWWNDSYAGYSSGYRRGSGAISAMAVLTVTTQTNCGDAGCPFTSSSNSGQVTQTFGSAISNAYTRCKQSNNGFLGRAYIDCYFTTK